MLTATSVYEKIAPLREIHQPNKENKNMTTFYSSANNPIPSAKDVGLKGYKSIGKGHFTNVFHKEGDDTVLVTSRCYVKECISQGWIGDSELFPTFERTDIGTVYDTKDAAFTTYKVKKYEKVSKIMGLLNDEHKNLYRELRKVDSFYFGNYEGYSHLNAEFDKLSISEEHKEALREALDGLANYGQDMMFEISPRNIFIEDDKLILSDVFFMKSQLRWN